MFFGTRAVLLVCSVSTISIAVAQKQFVDANVFIGTFKLILVASFIFAAHFVAKVLAVELTVALKTTFEAASVGTSKVENSSIGNNIHTIIEMFVLPKFGFRACSHRAVKLIAVIIAIGLIITTPPAGNASATVASEIRRLTRHVFIVRRTTLGLVLLFTAVCLAVTQPSLRNASTRLGTSKKSTT